MGKSLGIREIVLLFSLGLVALLVAISVNPASFISASVELGITASSPLGAAGGVVIPASCSSYEHTVGECDTAPIGYHDGLTCSVTNGWACDASDYGSALTIEFYKDGPAGSGGTYAWNTTANITREAAVGTLCGGNASHGFQSNVPSSLKDGASHSIYAYAINTGTAGANKTLLTNSPRSISCAAVTPPSFTVNGASSATITSGSSATLQWSCSNSTSSSGGGFSTGGATTGSVSVTPAVGTTQYTVQCSNGGQSTVSVTVSSAIMNISANPALVRSGGTSVISWSASNVNSCTVTGTGISASGLSGSATTPAITAETTYTLTCQVTGLGAVSRPVTVKLVPKFEEF